MAIKAQMQPDIADAFGLVELRSFRVPGGITYAVVGHNPGSRLLSDIWFGDFHHEREFQVVLEYIAEQFETGQYDYWLADLRFMASSFHNSHDWLVGTLMPRIFNAGLVREAVVLPTSDVQVPEGFDVLGSATKAIRELSEGVVRGFHNVEKAKAWLVSGDLSFTEMD